MASLVFRRFFGLLALAAFAGWGTSAQAARSFTYTQAPAVGTQFDMGSTQSLTFAITNTATGGQAGERIHELRFRISSGSQFSAATAPPAGWTTVALSATSVTFRASSWGNAIAVGGSRAFTLSITMRSTTANVNERLQDIRASFTNTTTGPPFTQRGTSTRSNAGGWTLMSLAITSFQITDTLGTPVSAITAGSSFRLVMTVRNNSTTSRNNIVSSPNPPTPVKTGTVTQALTGTAGSPLTLPAGASGSITFTYSTLATDVGTISFTAIARRTATVTSKITTSSLLAVGRFSASITASPSCQYVGANVTVTMALDVGYPYSILNVTPTLTPVAGAPVTAVSGPAPAAPIASVPPSPPTTIVTWTYQVNAAGTTTPFNFSGSATGTGNTAGSPTHTTQVTNSGNVARGSFATGIAPTVVNAGSANVELSATVTNNGCAAVNSVAITAPAGWTGAGDPYSLVSLTAGSAIETWVAGGANPVTFTAPDAAGQMPLGFGGRYSVVYATTPAAATTSVFTLRVTDANGAFVDHPLSVTVNAFKSGTLNRATTRTAREDFR